VVTTKNAVFWDAKHCGSCNNRRFGATYRLHDQFDKNRLARNNVSSNQQLSLYRVLRMLVNAKTVPSLPILVKLMMEAIRCPETSALTRTTRLNITSDGIQRSI
jgi:hypothetical protein